MAKEKYHLPWLNYYLENGAHCSITGNGTNLKLPDPLPVAKEKLRKETPYKYRYYILYYFQLNRTVSQSLLQTAAIAASAAVSFPQPQP